MKDDVRCRGCGPATNLVRLSARPSPAFQTTSVSYLPQVFESSYWGGKKS